MVIVGLGMVVRASYNESMAKGKHPNALLQQPEVEEENRNLPSLHG